MREMGVVAQNGEAHLTLEHLAGETGLDVAFKALQKSWLARMLFGHATLLNCHQPIPCCCLEQRHKE